MCTKHPKAGVAQTGKGNKTPFPWRKQLLFSSTQLFPFFIISISYVQNLTPDKSVETDSIPHVQEGQGSRSAGAHPWALSPASSRYHISLPDLHPDLHPDARAPSPGPHEHPTCMTVSVISPGTRRGLRLWFTHCWCHLKASAPRGTCPVLCLSVGWVRSSHMEDRGRAIRHQ